MNRYYKILGSQIPVYRVVLQEQFTPEEEGTSASRDLVFRIAFPGMD